MPKNAGPQPEIDTPVEIHGYKTDPLRRGYQILWNYESTYWRCLVGNDAWSLYEVLRSFCHEGNNICRPSINLLVDILRLKQRRVLTGWVTKVKGKEYQYPGLIEILQRYKLVTAEIKGKGPKMRYVFHVDLTPGLLSEEQLAELPKLLQKKHTELLKRCEQAKEELEAKRRPDKVAQKVDEKQSGGSDKLSEGYDNLSEGYDNLSGEHYPLTLPKEQQQKRKKNNNSSDEVDDKKDVVVALTEKGISKKIAQRLVSRYSHDRIFQKIDYLEFLLETEPDKINNPQGWLRRAIEEDYAPPDGYKSPEERAAEEKAHQKAKKEQERREAARRAQEEAERVEELKAREEELRALKTRYRTSEREEKAWSEILDQIKARQHDPAFYQTYLAESVLLSLKDNQATIWVPVAGDINKQLVDKRFGLIIRQLLAKHRDVSLKDVSITWLTPAANGQPEDSE